MSLKLNTASGGSITLQEADTASNYTVTIPAATGTMITTGSTFAGNGPAFAAYMSSTVQSLSGSTYTKIAFNTEYFDTNSNYDTTNYRFTPTTAGYYQVNVVIAMSENGSGGIQDYAFLYKNGSAYTSTRHYNGGQPMNNAFSCLVYLNGSTDYIEVYAWGSGGTPLVSNGGINANQFSSSFVRSA